MTVPAATKGALVLVAVALAGCQGARALDPNEADASSALHAAEQLERRVDALERSLRTSESESEQLAIRVGRLSERLSKSLERLRSSIRELGSSSAAAETSAAAAAADADAALGRIDSVARDLSVLRSRLDYHLRAHPGGR